ncbi:DUF6499 domain-containing protein [Mesorhizobium sp.]|uniref:transcriptional regulator domain-containing protein n=1 Tax=Mesorhizobium sp. TaxID=1871066 RepID=UPI0025DE08FB|nr:DUF6499 domain-containing protein [Mesorhizobium sp.]
MPISDWRSSDTIERLNRLDRRGFAVELLRRNAAYRGDYARTLSLIQRNGSDSQTALAGLARRWGLCFCP